MWSTVFLQMLNYLETTIHSTFKTPFIFPNVMLVHHLWQYHFPWEIVWPPKILATKVTQFYVLFKCFSESNVTFIQKQMVQIWVDTSRFNHLLVSYTYESIYKEDSLATIFSIGILNGESGSWTETPPIKCPGQGGKAENTEHSSRGNSFRFG